MTDYSSKSLYYKTPQTSWSLSHYVHREIPLDDSDVYILIEDRHKYKPTGLSFDLYGTPAYWWVFNVLNMDIIQDPISDFIPGKIIRTPTLNRLKKLIG